MKKHHRKWIFSVKISIKVTIVNKVREANDPVNCGGEGIECCSLTAKLSHVQLLTLSFLPPSPSPIKPEYYVSVLVLQVR